MYKKYFKRFFDIIFSIVFIIILLPISIIIGIVCKISVGKVFFCQKRDGLNKKSFTMYKFCSMKNIEGNNIDRTTKITRIIRSLGLDELPQLINILKGDMSFIGPRPFITLEKLTTYPNDIVYAAKPGVISLACAKGRRKISHENRLKYDEIYVKNITFKNDIVILFQTLGVLIKQNIRGEVWKR